MNKVLVVVDMQNDFIDGALGTPEAQAIVPRVKKEIEKFLVENPNGKLFFTRDTHYKNYLETQEGKNLPVEHCIQGTYGWEIADLLQEFLDEAKIYNKLTFGSYDLAYALNELNNKNLIEEITLVGIDTSICVLSNTILIKAMLPEVKINVVADCCSSINPAIHNQALETMKICQINIIGECPSGKEG